MTIAHTKNGNALTVALEGRLDTMTAPELETFLKDALADVEELTVDLAKLDYISSAGLRVLLATQKAVQGRDGMVIRNITDEVREIFEVTGFMDILTVE